jgi:hypothetical protein
MYFAHKYPERREQLDLLLGGAADAAGRSEAAALEIFSRLLGGEPAYQFPVEFTGQVVGSLNYAQMLTAYRAYKVFLNVNSVVESPSMCARRIFEISASGAPVVSTPSEAVSKFFPADEVFVADSRATAAAQIRMLAASAELRERTVHKAQRRIWDQHTYAHRGEQVVSAVLPERARPVELPTVTALVSTVRPAQLEYVLSSVGRQSGVRTELVLLTHGFQADPGQVDELAREHGVSNLQLLTAPRELSLGECLNRCVLGSNGEVLTKMDDDDYYGPEYLRDLLHALEFSRATVVGKQAHYMHFLSRGATVLRSGHKEHQYSRLVAGPTITARREVFQAHPFAPINRGEDTGFLESVSQSGGAIYSADRFNFCQIRSGTGHTWDVSDEELMASGAINLFGDPIAHITV